MQTTINLNYCGPISLPTFADARGKLTVVNIEEAGKLLPFVPSRVFWIHDADESAVRGEHAHQECWELVCALSGSFSLSLSNGEEWREFTMNTPDKGIIIPPMVWCRLHDFAPSTVCLALASGQYDAEGYINDFETYKERIKTQNK